MKQDKKTKLAYAAGFLDGEGCIKIAKRNPRNGRSANYSLLVSITQKDGRPVDWLFGNFGGVVYLKNKKTDGSNWIYEWRSTDTGAYKFLKSVVPFLLVKKEQAELAIQFQERREFARKRNKPDNGRFASLTKDELSKREEIYQKMSELKWQYKKSKNPNVKEYTFKSMVQP